MIDLVYQNKMEESCKIAELSILIWVTECTQNCSASGMKKEGGHHVVKAFCLINITTLLRSLFF